MATKLIFNPLSGNFDAVTVVTATTVGSTPNANAVSIGSDGDTIQLQPADATHPGVVTALAQTFGGNKTFSGSIATSSIDTASAGGTLALGTLNATTINIGNVGATVNIMGTVITETSTTLNVTNPVFTVNHGGGSGSASNSGMQIEEAGTITGYVETSADRNSFILKAPNTAGIATITPGVAGITINQSSHDPVTIGTANGLSLAGQVLSLALASGSTNGALSSTDFTTFTNKANASLNNLASTAVNVAINPATNNAIGFGNASLQWGNVYANSYRTVNGSYQLVNAAAFFSVGTVPSIGTGGIPAIQNNSNSATPNARDVGIFTASNTSTGLAGSGAVYIESGLGGTGTTGDINLNTGTTSGTRGKILLNASFIDANSTQIKNLATPSIGSDAANKTYVDSIATPNAITALMGDGSANGPGAVNFTLAVVNTTAGSYGTSSAVSQFTINSKGLVTFGGQTSIQIVESQVTGLTADLAAKANRTTGDIDTTSFSAANNVSTPANVTGLAFANGVTRAFTAFVSVTVLAGSNLYEYFEIKGIQKASSWEIAPTSVGDSSGFIFSITSAGQIQYTDLSYSGLTSATLKFRAITTPV